jgi:hypothetical protein
MWGSRVTTEPSRIQRPVRCSVMVICLALVGVLLCSPAPAVAQTPPPGTIRVESKEVLVPVLVLDKKRVEELRHMKRSHFWRRVNDGDFRFLERLSIRGLSASDFTVLQDGEEERIETIKPEEQKGPPVVTDNLGKYREFLGIGGGTWAVSLWEYTSAGREIIELPALSGYEIGYTPSSSLGGSCHKIQITVNRLNSIVFARSEYCDASRKGADPLQGTMLGERIESDLQKGGRRDLTFDVAAIPLLGSDGTARVRIILDYTSQRIVGSCTAVMPENIGILGRFMSSTGREILRFSDETERTAYGDPPVGQFWGKLVGRFVTAYRCSFAAPFRYETQVEMPPGKYRLQIGFVDGKKFGLTEVPLTVPSYRSEELSISGIALARRFRNLQLQTPETPAAVSPRKFEQFPMQGAESPIALPQNYAPLVSRGAEVTPTANTRFQKKGPLCFFFQIYEPPSSQPQQARVKAEMQIVDTTTARVVRQVKAIDAAPFAQPGNPLIPISGRLNISELPDGAYELQAKATDSSGASTQWQSAAFVVQ